MRSLSSLLCKKLLLIFFLFLINSAWYTKVQAQTASLRLSWTDTSDNEDGFKIQRLVGGLVDATLTIATNATSYIDSALVAGTIYCYRVEAFNSAGDSAPSNQVCGTTSVPDFTLTLTKTGNGSGSVSSSPAGISCGGDCSENYPSGTVISLSAIPASGSTFTGWSGDTDCSDGKVTLANNKSCTATFSLNRQGITLTVNIASNGGGGGRVTSSPVGIDCGSDCSENYPSGTVVSLNAIPASGSKFAGWSGDADCKDGKVKLGKSKSCTATFSPNSAVTLTNSTPVIANFVGTNPTSIGIFRASTGAWFSDINRNRIWDGCNVDSCLGSFGVAGDLPVAGDWTGTGRSYIGVFRPSTGEWFLDLNGNARWDGCNVDGCLGSFGVAGDLPVAGDWTSTGRSYIGVFRPSTGEWFLDLNGNARWDGCNVDGCLGSFGVAGDLPVAGDWTSTGRSYIGVFRPSTSEWFLDLNGNAAWDGCNVDSCLGSFGVAGDLPVAGDWTGTRRSYIGVFRPSTSEWFLDNGNGKWDDCSIDRCNQFLSNQEGDLPVAGNW